ncbi:MAG: hypothetical protein LW832_09365 [Parachlamydia sp.]|jgi:hypothetical protein|nr:hypothetical protein [Parachlamydia sp.]
MHHYQAMKELGKGEFLFDRPNVPLDWAIQILHHDQGLLYFNPSDPQEFIKVMPPRTDYEDLTYHEYYVVYHKLSMLMAKTYENKIKFDWQNKQHISKLDSILTSLNTRYPDGLPDGEIKLKKTREAGKLFENFWFNLEDLQFVREYLGFNKISQDIIQHIHEITCECHEISLSDSGAGILYQHKEHHYYNTRIAHHPIPGERPFVKVGGAAGYHTANGKVLTANAATTHLLISDVLGNPLDWNITPCKKVYRLRKFDYEKAKTFMANYFTQEQKKGHRYVSKIG